MTAMAEKMVQAGVDTAAAQLYQEAHKALLKSDCNKTKARLALRAALERRPDLLNALLSFYLDRVLQDMRGPGRRDEEAVGQLHTDTPAQNARPSSRYDDADGHILHGAQTEAASASSPDEETAGHHSLDDHQRPARPSSRNDDGVGHTTDDTHGRHARPSSLHRDGEDQWNGALVRAKDRMSSSSRPNADVEDPLFNAQPRHSCAVPHVRTTEQKRAALAVYSRSAEAVFQTFKLRDGRAIGYVRWNELDGIARSSRLEARVVEKIRNHATPADIDRPVRDCVSAADLERFIAEAKKELHNVL